MPLYFSVHNKGLLIDAQRASSALWGIGACLSLHSLIQFLKLPSQQQAKRSCYLWFLGTLFLLSTIFCVVLVIQAGVPGIDLRYLREEITSRKSSKRSIIMAVCTSALELIGGAFMVTRATIALRSNKHLKLILGATYAVFLGVCIASLLFQTKAITRVGEVTGSVNRPLSTFCQAESVVVPMVNPTTNLNVSDYLDTVHHICTKEFLYASDAPSVYFPGVGMKLGADESAAAARACHYHPVGEMDLLQYNFSERLIKPIQNAHRWWRAAEFMGSVGVSIVCTGLIGIRTIYQDGLAGGSRRSSNCCESGSSQGQVPLITALIESGLPSAIIGVVGIPIRIRKLALDPPPVDRFHPFNVHPSIYLNHVVHTLWLHALVGARLSDDPVSRPVRKIMRPMQLGSNETLSSATPSHVCVARLSFESFMKFAFKVVIYTSMPRGIQRGLTAMNHLARTSNPRVYAIDEARRRRLRAFELTLSSDTKGFVFEIVRTYRQPIPGIKPPSSWWGQCELLTQYKMRDQLGFVSAERPQGPKKCMHQWALEGPAQDASPLKSKRGWVSLVYVVVDKSLIPDAPAAACVSAVAPASVPVALVAAAAGANNMYSYVLYLHLEG
ncbi:hypothetical protein BKA70DRAFT_1229218 [Coprinopsis sp. MPI-PUGE-AT-0042]|nr:hypothetical protein BKA70DRAFT_1229218 [Coprinopsis sp. MPI-PUGE-AT-0042]